MIMKKEEKSCALDINPEILPKKPSITRYNVIIDKIN